MDFVTTVVLRDTIENAEARSAEVIFVGGSLQTVAPETGKVRSPKPKLERRLQGATNWRRETERRLERAMIADVWVKVRRHLQPVEADQGVGDVSNATKIEDHTSNSILDEPQARNDDIRESDQDAVAVVEPHKD
jgi:hypothetical protein